MSGVSNYQPDTFDPLTPYPVQWSITAQDKNIRKNLLEMASLMTDQHEVHKTQHNNNFVALY